MYVVASSADVTGQVQQSPFVEAHLASLASQSPQSTEKQPSPESSSEVLSSDESSEPSTGREDEAAMFSQAAPASRMFIFDDSTVARVPGEEAAAQKPWDAAREAEFTQAEAAIKAGRPRRGLPDTAAAYEPAAMAPEQPQFREPAKYDDLPYDLQPRFREIIRCSTVHPSCHSHALGTPNRGVPFLHRKRCHTQEHHWAADWQSHEHLMLTRHCTPPLSSPAAGHCMRELSQCCPVSEHHASLLRYCAF